MVSGLALVDSIMMDHGVIRTVCNRHAAGMAALVLAAGSPGARSVGRDARIAFTRSWSPKMRSDAIARDEVRRMDAEISRLFARFTGQSVDTVSNDLKAERTFTAEDAISYGLADVRI